MPTPESGVLDYYVASLLGPTDASRTATNDGIELRVADTRLLVARDEVRNIEAWPARGRTRAAGWRAGRMRDAGREVRLVDTGVLLGHDPRDTYPRLALLEHAPFGLGCEEEDFSASAGPTARSTRPGAPWLVETPPGSAIWLVDVPALLAWLTVGPSATTKMA